MKSQAINVIILPDEETEQKARELGTSLRDKFNSFYTLENKKYIPHATIYQAQYPTKNYGKIKAELEEITEGLSPFSVYISQYLNHYNYIWWNISPEQKLREVHYKILNFLSPLREGLLYSHIKKDFSGYSEGGKFTEEESENAKKYGAVIVAKLFQPHITLGKLNLDYEVQDEKIQKILPKSEMTFEVKEICIGKMGNYGTVLEIIERFPFKNY